MDSEYAVFKVTETETNSVISLHVQEKTPHAKIGVLRLDSPDGVTFFNVSHILVFPNNTLTE
jgi:hypothetical protein